MIENFISFVLTIPRFCPVSTEIIDDEIERERSETIIRNKM